MWRQVVAQSPGKNAPAGEVVRYDVGWKALNTMLKSGRSLSGHERNICFLNTRGGRFADISAAADLDFDDDGRVIALVDWDFDGDLDFWIANRTGPQCRFLRNDHENDHGFVAFKLEGVRCNRDAIGSRVELYLGDDPDHPKRIRTLRAGEGYLAQSSKWIHFGTGRLSDIQKVVVRWPGGLRETFADISVNRRYTLKQGSGKAVAWSPPQRSISLHPSKIKVPPSTDQSRIVLISPVPIPVLHYTNANGQDETVASTKGRPRLINLWTTWCQPCLAELNEWKQHEDDLRRSGLEIVAVNVDEPTDTPAARKELADSVLDRLGFPFERGLGSPDLVLQFDVLQRAIVRRQKPMPVPSSFLIDARGNLRIIYKGPVSVEQLMSDASLLDASPEQIVASSVPYEGIWLGTPAGASPNQIAIKMVEGGFIKETIDYIKLMQTTHVDNPMYNRAEANVLLGAIYLDQNRLKESVEAFRAALKSDPNHRQSHIELGRVLARLQQFEEAAQHYEKALERRTNDPELRFRLGMARLQNGETDEAIRQLKQSAKLRPTPETHYQLGNILNGKGQMKAAADQYDAALRVNPHFVPSMNNLAWVLATCADPDVRDGDRAVKLSERVCGRKSARTASNLDTLAAAYAEAGRFGDATQAIKEAIRLAKSTGDLDVSRRMEKRLVLYQQKQPYHAP